MVAFPLHDGLLRPIDNVQSIYTLEVFEIFGDKNEIMAKAQDAMPKSKSSSLVPFFSN